MRAWLISNIASGSTDAATLESLPALLPDIDIVGHSGFPAEALPSVEKLDSQDVSLILLLAGDGTINAAATRYDNWRGAVLILPGGTMNMLASSLHGSAGIAEIARAVTAGDAVRTTLPYVAVGDRRAYVAAIAGPASLWAHAREAVRSGRLRQAWRATRLAWLRSFARGPRVRGCQRARSSAILLLPESETIEIARIGVTGWMEAARLGLDYVASDWRRSPNVDIARANGAVLEGGRSVHMLFDGEAARMRLPLTVRHGRSRLAFLATRPEALDMGRRAQAA